MKFTQYVVVASTTRFELARDAAAAINRRLADAGDSHDLHTVQREIELCDPLIRYLLKIEALTLKFD